MNPLVTVLIDTYNHERYVEQSIVSVMEQDFPASDFEILVVDDGSTDRTPEIVRKFAPRVRLLRKKNGGQASAFNAGWREVRGDIVAFLDGDDWWVRSKLSAVMTVLEQEPDIAAVAHGYYEFYEETNQSELRVASESQILCMETPAASARCLSAFPGLHKGAFTVRANLLRECMPISERLIFNADTPIAMAAIARGTRLLREPLFYYRIHSENLYAARTLEEPGARRNFEMADAMFDASETMLKGMGIKQECISAVLDESWVASNREMLRRFGGKRGRTFQTEMRQFRHEHRDPSLAYSLYKYLVVGAAAFVLPPRAFYAARSWYGRQSIGRVREQIVKSQ